MNSEAKGYGFKGRQPIGRSIVEGRGNSYKLTVWAQDLKAETFYKVFLLFADQKGYAGIDMGNLLVDEKGKGETRRDFDRDVLGEFALADIAGVAVIARDAPDVVSPLCGYRDQPVMWRGGFYEYKMPVAKVGELVEIPKEVNSSADAAPQEAAAIEEEAKLGEAVIIKEEPDLGETVAIDTFAPLLQVEELAETPTEEAADASTQSISPAMQLGFVLQDEPVAENPACEPEEVADELLLVDAVIDLIPLSIAAQPELAVPEEVPELKESAIAQPQTAAAEPFTIAPPHKPTGGMAKAFREALDKLYEDNLHQNAENMPNSQFLSVFETKEAVTPFQRQARNTKWVRFNLSDSVPPPTNNPHLFDDPFIHAALETHEHMILGKTVDQGPCRYIIGVPGVYGQASRLKAKRLGFVQFKCSRDTHPTWGDAGYWLMFISVC